MCQLELYDRLANTILDKLDIKVNSVADSQSGTFPTASCDALRLNNQAVALANNGHIQEAERLLQQALTLDEHYADAYSNLGWVLRRQEAWAAAEEAYLTAIQLQPNQPIYHFNLGVLYDRMEAPAEAVMAYEQALKLDIGYVRAYSNLGLTYLQLEQLDKAKKALNRGIAWYETFEGPGYGSSIFSTKNRGRFYLADNQPGSAVADLQRARDLYRGDAVFAEALYYLAQAQYGVQEFSLACNTLGIYLQNADQDSEPGRSVRANQQFDDWHCTEEETSE